MGGKERQGHGLPTAELKVESTLTAAEAWPSSFSLHLFCKEGSRERPQHMLLTCWSHGLWHLGTGSGKEAGLPVPRNGLSHSPAHLGPKLRALLTPHPHIQPAGSPAKSFSNTFSNPSTSVPPADGALSRPSSSPPWTPATASSLVVLLPFCSLSSAPARLMLQNVGCTTSLLKAFQRCPHRSLNKIQAPGPGLPDPSNEPLHQPHTSCFSCCLLLTPCATATSASGKAALSPPGLSSLALPPPGTPPHDSASGRSLTCHSGAHCQVLASTGWMTEGLVVRDIVSSGALQKEGSPAPRQPRGDCFQP